MIEGALKLEDLTVKDATVPWQDVISYPANMTLDEKGLRDLHSTGCSRVPVWEGSKHNIVGLCLVKNLVPVRPSRHHKLLDYSKRKPLVVTKDMNLFDLLNFFQAQRSHFALVVNDDNAQATVEDCFASKNGNKRIPDEIAFLGIITLEDVIEEVIQEPIFDETEPTPHAMMQSMMININTMNTASAPASDMININIKSDSQMSYRSYQSYHSNNYNNSNKSKDSSLKSLDLLGVAENESSYSARYSHLNSISKDEMFIESLKKRHISLERKNERRRRNALKKNLKRREQSSYRAYSRMNTPTRLFHKNKNKNDKSKSSRSMRNDLKNYNNNNNNNSNVNSKNGKNRARIDSVPNAQKTSQGGRSLYTAREQLGTSAEVSVMLGSGVTVSAVPRNGSGIDIKYNVARSRQNIDMVGVDSIGNINGNVRDSIVNRSGGIAIGGGGGGSDFTRKHSSKHTSMRNMNVIRKILRPNNGDGNGHGNGNAYGNVYGSGGSGLSGVSGLGVPGVVGGGNHSFTESTMRIDSQNSAIPTNYGYYASADNIMGGGVDVSEVSRLIESRFENEDEFDHIGAGGGAGGGINIGGIGGSGGGYGSHGNYEYSNTNINDINDINNENDSKNNGDGNEFDISVDLNNSDESKDELNHNKEENSHLNIDFIGNNNKFRESRENMNDNDNDNMKAPLLANTDGKNRRNKSGNSIQVLVSENTNTQTNINDNDNDNDTNISNTKSVETTPLLGAKNKTKINSKSNTNTNTKAVVNDYGGILDSSHLAGLSKEKQKFHDNVSGAARTKSTTDAK